MYEVKAGHKEIQKLKKLRGTPAIVQLGAFMIYHRCRDRLLLVCPYAIQFLSSSLHLALTDSSQAYNLHMHVRSNTVRTLHVGFGGDM